MRDSFELVGLTNALIANIDAMHSNTLTILTALVGAVTGPAAFVLSLLNYFRDKPKVIVSLEWDRCLIGGVNEDKKFGVVTVANVGRRPIFISHAHLRFPGSTVFGLLTDGLKERNYWKVIRQKTI